MDHLSLIIPSQTESKAFVVEHRKLKEKQWDTHTHRERERERERERDLSIRVY